jgi:hypothetical protein
MNGMLCSSKYYFSPKLRISAYPYSLIFELF